MSAPPTNPIIDPIRLAALKATRLLDSPPEPSFDRLTRLAAKLLGAPVALVSLVDTDRQFFKSSVGLPDFWAQARQTPLSHSFCQHIIISGKPLIVNDARTMPLVQGNGAICDLGVVAYLGVPIVTEAGVVLGSFCVIDGVPRIWTEEEFLLLRDLADSVSAEITLRVEKAELQRAEMRLSVQHAAALVLAGAASLDEAIGPILKLVGEGLGYEIGEFWRFDAASDRLLRDDEDWMSGPSFAPFAAASRQFTFGKGEGLPGRVWASGKPSWIEDIALDDNFQRREVAASSGLRCGFGMPIADDHGIVGVMVFFNCEPIAADDLLLQALTTLSRQIGQFAMRRSSERLLRDSEIRFRQSFENAPIGMALVATDGHFLRVNCALCKILGYTDLQLLGMDFQCVTHPNDLENDLDHMRRLLDDSITGYQIEKRYLHGDGRVVWALLGVSLVRDPSGDPLYFIAQIQDISDRKEIEAALHRARDGAMEAARAKSDFLANMSHEVRTPMAAVLGYSDMLLNPRLLQAERDQALQAIRRNGSHLLQIINDILDLSKIEAGRVELDLIPYSPWQVALEVASVLRIGADEKGVALQTLALGPLPDLAVMDPTRVRQILVNLVSNAIKFSEPGGLVALRIGASLTVDARQVTLQLEVEDRGIGMTPEQVEQLFIPFQQADSTTTRRFGGTGLGLSISRRLAEAMGGVVSVGSEIGRGSCFTVSIPIQVDEPNVPWLEPDQLAIRVAPEEKHDETLGQILFGRILLAEDNPDNQKILLYHLCRMGLEVVIVDNGRLAVEKALRGNYDLILMDMQMPELDGYGATSSLRRAGFKAPIIALTAHAMVEDRERCLRVGCTDFLTKPVDARVLAAAIAQHLNSGPTQFAVPDDAIHSNLWDDPDLSGLIRSFAEGLPERAERFRSMIALGDLSGVRSLAHQIRGVGGMYGYPGLTETAALIEESIVEGQDGELLEELVDEFAEMASRIGLGLDDRIGEV